MASNALVAKTKRCEVQPLPPGGAKRLAKRPSVALEAAEPSRAAPREPADGNVDNLLNKD
jgi:hypothetical protein